MQFFGIDLLKENAIFSSKSGVFNYSYIYKFYTNIGICDLIKYYIIPILYGAVKNCEILRYRSHNIIPV